MLFTMLASPWETCCSKRLRWVCSCIRWRDFLPRKCERFMACPKSLNRSQRSRSVMLATSIYYRKTSENGNSARAAENRSAVLYFKVSGEKSRRLFRRHEEDDPRNNANDNRRHTNTDVVRVVCGHPFCVISWIVRSLGLTRNNQAR